MGEVNIDLAQLDDAKIRSLIGQSYAALRDRERARSQSFRKASRAAEARLQDPKTTAARTGRSSDG